MDQLVQSVATGLEIVECELLGASSYHGKRIAVLCALMGKETGMSEDEIKAVTTCALFHDNALTEYIQYMHKNKDREKNFMLHCEYGQRNVEMLPFDSDVSGLILYHHEHADGSGLYGKKEGEFPLGAQLIAIADMVDVRYHLQRVDTDKLPKIRDEIASFTGRYYTKPAAEALLAVLDAEALMSLHDENILQTTTKLLPEWQIDTDDDALMRIAGLIAKIIDLKSPFTKRHTIQIANRAWLMGGYYNFDKEKRTKVYLAASLHDLGKLGIPNAILDKPAKLTEEEFGIIKSHVRGTYDMLCDISGFEEICRWASTHHEKLDGTGYCFGKKSEELDFVDRVLACTDIYQAVCEERPYHPERSHEETMPILWSMADKGFIDREIVKDFDIAMAEYSHKYVPDPL